jgi:DNA modification methylase
MPMTPYYDEDGITIYHGDCRELWPMVAHADAVVTDPPYGIGADKRQAARAHKQHGNAVAPSRFYGHTDWDQAPEPSTISAMLAVGGKHIVWGGNHLGLSGGSGWLVWDKETGNNGYADAELAWTDLVMATRLFRFRWMGMLQALPEARVHPTQKPIPLMRWCLGFLNADDLVLDPFMGSGTTLRAAKDLGRRAIGIEIEERYCEIAVQRLAQGVLAL